MEKIYSKEYFMKGMKKGIPIAVGYIPIAVTFGLLAKSLEIPNLITILMSLMVFAGASQFVGVNLIFIGASFWEIIFTTFILNFRHFLMSSSLSQRIKSETEKIWLGILSFGITDETFSIASLQEEEKLCPKFLLGLNFVAYSSWVLGTILGVFIASGLPPLLKSSMGIALYAMFIGLLVPSWRTSNPVLITSLIAIFINTFLNWSPAFNILSTGWNIIISTITASLIGTFLFPEGVKK